MEYTRQTAEEMIAERYGVSAPYIIRMLQGDIDFIEKWKDDEEHADVVKYVFNKVIENARYWYHNLLMPTTVQVGDGVTLHWFTDSDPYTVIGKTKTGKTIVIQEDKATRTDDNGVSDCQTYEYTRDPDGVTITARWSDKYNCYVWQGQHVTAGRRKYYDYSF